MSAVFMVRRDAVNISRAKAQRNKKRHPLCVDMAKSGSPTTWGFRPGSVPLLRGDLAALQDALSDVEYTYPSFGLIPRHGRGADPSTACRRDGRSGSPSCILTARACRGILKSGVLPCSAGGNQSRVKHMIFFICQNAENLQTRRAAPLHP